MLFHYYSLVVVINLAVFCNCIFQETRNNKTSLHLGVLHPLSNGFAVKAAKGYLQVAMLAIRDVNNRHDLLRDYNLESTVLDTKVLEINCLLKSYFILM